MAGHGALLLESEVAQERVEQQACLRSPTRLDHDGESITHQPVRAATVQRLR